MAAARLYRDVPFLTASSHLGPRLGGFIGLMSRAALNHLKASITRWVLREPRPTIGLCHRPSS